MSDPKSSSDTIDKNIVRQNTTNLIIEVMDKLMYDGDYETAMLNVLEALGKSIHADRCYILEMGARLDSSFVEWCNEGIEPRLEVVQKFSDSAVRTFMLQFREQDRFFLGTLEELGITHEGQLAYFRRYGVDRIAVLSLFDKGRYIGCLAADNYTFDNTLDFIRLVDTIGSSMTTVILNHQLMDELEWSSTHDSLTGLLNRLGIDRASEKALEENPGISYALGLVDIDNFKTVNDLYGHTAGDIALSNLACALEDSFPPGSILGRNGGDELLVMLLGDDASQADTLFSQFAGKQFEIDYEGASIALTISIGYARCPDHAVTLAEVYKLADAALYAVKLAGKSQAIRYSDDLDFRYRAQLGFTPRDIAENLPGGILVYQARGNGDIMFANKSIADLFECDDINEFMDLVKGCYRYMVHPDDCVRVYEETKSQTSLNDLGTLYSVDFRIVTKNGTIKDVAQNGVLVDIEGVGVVVYTIIIDHAGHSARQ